MTTSFVPLASARRTFETSPAGELSESTRREHDAPPLLNADGPAIRGWMP